MTSPPVVVANPGLVAKRLVTGVVVLAVTFGVSSILLNPGSLRTTAIRLLAIVLSGVLVGKGVRWARILLVLLTGLIAPYAVVLAVVRPMPLGWRAAFLVYGVGTLWGLIGLFRQPAAAYFTARPVAEGGA
jgi:hypothetical protein